MNQMTVINTGFIANPYRQFEIEIQPGQIHPLRYVHNTVEVLANNQPGFLKINFGGSGGFTEFEQGMIYAYPNGVSIPFIELQNNSANVMKLTVVLAVGEFKDQRLNISGTVVVQSTPDNPVYSNPAQYTSCAITNVTFDSTGTASFDVPAGTKKVLIQNTGTSDVRVMGQNGFIINPMGTFELNYSGTIQLFGTSGQTAVVGAWK